MFIVNHKKGEHLKIKFIIILSLSFYLIIMIL